jgi:multidrug efflux pump subunit AcrA (membrane-fusion protein)
MAQETAEGQAAAAPQKHTVKKGPLTIEVSLSGVFEAEQMTPVSVETEEWSSLSVLDSVPHGTTVKAGDVLVSFDLKKIDEAIADLENSQKLTDLTIEQSKEELRALEVSLPAELELAEQSKQMADEDLKQFVEKMRPIYTKSAEFMLKSAANSLEYQQEELDQLEKMYKADDLTEETEEIILKRAKNDVEFASFYLEYAKVNSEQSLQVFLPREEVMLKERARRTSLELQRAKVALPVALNKAKLGMEKTLQDHAQAAERLTKLKKDREAMIVKAPTDGILYYGQCQRGKWSSSAGSEGKYIKGATLTPKTVFMTIVQPKPMFVRTSTAEKDLAHVQAGVTGRVTSVAYPHSKLPAKVESVAAVPTADGAFDTKITVELPADLPALLPGMTSNVTVVAYDKPDAIAVPASAVFEEADGKHYVYRVGADDSRQKAEVTVGKRTDDKAEIVQGLLEGDTILLAKPSGG